ncbi:MAG: ATP-binding protein [Myxococcota bacterium]|nr:ATP-binding protein [Myxococcota bacterium]
MSDVNIQRNRVIALAAFGAMLLLLVRAAMDYMGGVEGLWLYFEILNAIVWPLIILFGLRIGESKTTLIYVVCVLFILQVGIFYFEAAGQNVGVLFALVVLPMISILLSGWSHTIGLSILAVGLASMALWFIDQPFFGREQWSEAETRKALLRDVILLIAAVSMFTVLIKWLQRTALAAMESARQRAEWSERKARGLLQHQSITLQAAQELQSAEDHEIDLQTTEILHLVASLVNADYASLTLWDPHYEKMHARFHWKAPKIPMVRTEWHSFSTLYRWSASELKKNSFIAVDDIADLPFEARPEQELMKERGVRSWLSAVVRVGDWASGILSVQCHTRRHQWLPDEISSMQLMSGILAGVVARQEAGRTIRERDASFSRVFEAHPEGLAIIACQDGKILEGNRGFLAMANLTESQEPSDRYFNKLNWSISDSSGEESIWSKIERAEEFGDCERGVQNQDEEHRQISFSGKPIEIADEHCILLSIRDVTRQRELEVQLRQAQKMEAVGLLAGGIAHDFNNMLTIISGFSEILYDAVDKDLQEDVQSIRDAARRSSALTRQLLAFSRRQVLKPEVINLNQLISEQKNLLKPLIGEDVRIKLDLEHTLQAVKADPGQIEQVIMNLATNGRDAMPEGGEITISTRNIEIDQNPADELNLGQGDFVCVCVEDTGTGMSKEVISRALEPFYTTKERGAGSGLGLSTAHGIIEQSGGALLIESQQDQGTKMRFYLPASNEDSLPIEKDGEHPISPQRFETILLVEDEGEVRRLAQLTLEASGYQVISAENGQDAIDKTRQHLNSVDLVLTDIVMPVMGGIRLIEILKEIKPDLKVAMMTGYPGGSPSEGRFVEGKYEIIPKPFKPDELRSAISAIIDAKAI